MSIQQTPGVFFVGPQGRAVNVSPSGQILATEAGALLVYSVSDKGRAIGVDANGRLGIQIASPITTSDFATSGSFNLNNGKQFDIILTENKTVTELSNPDEGGRYMFVLEQGTTGSHLVTWPSNVLWRGGVAPTLSTASGSVDVVTMVYRNFDNTFLADYGLNFS